MKDKADDQKLRSLRGPGGGCPVTNAMHSGLHEEDVIKVVSMYAEQYLW